ncbi:MAG TPA: SET domain-containing protein-lysine N-methyltransferase, partial [Prosthecobacter sp.]|nr:SET domain-containing protein-lysine N-methyltransferase [Prosthecobacter sp.]
MPVAATPPPAWIVRRSSIHQRGVFARRDILKEEEVIEYVGEKISKEESDRRGQNLMEKASKSGGAAVYIFTLNEEFDLDGGFSWNPARLINHSCDPNCEAFITDDRVWIYAKRDIAKGEELTFNYGFDMETWEDHPCRC